MKLRYLTVFKKFLLRKLKMDEFPDFEFGLSNQDDDQISNRAGKSNDKLPKLMSY